MSTTTLNLLLVQPGVNDPASNNIWGGLLNTDWQLVDDYTAGILNLSVAGASNVILTSIPGASDQSRRAHYNLSGVLTGNINVLWPQGLSRMFSVTNSTSGAFSLSCGANNGSGSPGGSTITVPQGQTVTLGSDGVNVFSRLTGAGIGALLAVNNLSDVANVATSRTNLGLGGLAVLGAGTGLTVGGGNASVTYGTSGGTAAQGNDSRITGALQSANNLSDVANAATSRTNLGVTATGNDTTYCYRSNNLSDVASAATSKVNLGITSAAINLGAPTGSTNPSGAHGLSGVPKIFQGYVVCTTAELGYNIGDHADINFGGGSTNDGCTSWANATTVGVNIGVNGIKIMNPSTHGGSAITAGNWTLFVVAILL